MHIKYYVEICNRKGNTEEICRIVPSKNSQLGRPLIKCYDIEANGAPKSKVISQLVDEIEEVFCELQKFGIQSDDISIWIECDHSNSFELNLDPMTLMALGTSGIKLCISSYINNYPFNIVNQSVGSRQMRLVEVEEIWIEIEERSLVPVGLPSPNLLGGKSEVIVRFDDQTSWSATFLSYQQLEGMIEERKRGLLEERMDYFWIPNMILVNMLTRKQIEQAIFHLLRTKSFEHAFSEIELDTKSIDELFLPKIESELSIIHDLDNASQIDTILQVANEDTHHSSNFWTLTRVELAEHTHLNGIMYLLDKLEGKYAKLADEGIFKKDIFLKWIYHHKTQTNAEFNPTLLKRIGKNGLNVSIGFSWLSDGYVRSIE